MDILHWVQVTPYDNMILTSKLYDDQCYSTGSVQYIHEVILNLHTQMLHSISCNNIGYMLVSNIKFIKPFFKHRDIKMDFRFHEYPLRRSGYVNINKNKCISDKMYSTEINTSVCLALPVFPDICQILQPKAFLENVACYNILRFIQNLSVVQLLKFVAFKASFH